MKLLKELLNESFSDTKRASGYYDTFVPVTVVWLDGVLHFLRYEEPFKSNLKAQQFADKVDQFFNERFGGMVYHMKDDKIIGNIIDHNLRELHKNPTSDQIKLQVSFTNQQLNNLKRKGIIALEGAHPEETDFWADQTNKERVRDVA